MTAYLSYLDGALQQNNLLSAGTMIALVIPLAVFFPMQRHVAPRADFRRPARVTKARS